jgi:hypothetical protein
MSKEELLTAADASKLADKPLRGDTNAWATQRGGANWYDGWSCIKVGQQVCSKYYYTYYL